MRNITVSEMHLWRRLLKLGGRAPNDAILILQGLSHTEVDLRTRRLNFFIRLINAPALSWQHQALIVQKNLQTEWYTRCCKLHAAVMDSFFMTLAEFLMMASGSLRNHTHYNVMDWADADA
eukprot:7844800-Karenia_brevis.AAC.1